MLDEREPLAIRGAVVAAIVVLIDVAVAFGWDLTMEQYAVLTTAVGLFGTLIVVLWSRGKVTPVADPHLPTTVYAELEESLDEEVDPDLVWDDEPDDFGDVDADEDYDEEEDVR